MGCAPVRSGSTVCGWRPVEQDIPDPGDALGPRPQQHEEQRDWEHVHEAIARDQRQLGRDVEVELDIDLGIGS